MGNTKIMKNIISPMFTFRVGYSTSA